MCVFIKSIKEVHLFTRVCLIVGSFVVRISQKLPNVHPGNLDGGWVSAQN